MKKLEAAALLVLIPIMLAACAHPQLIDLGTAESQVVQNWVNLMRQSHWLTVVRVSFIRSSLLGRNAGG